MCCVSACARTTGEGPGSGNVFRGQILISSGRISPFTTSPTVSLCPETPRAGVTCFGKRPARCFAAVTLIAEFYAGFFEPGTREVPRAPSPSTAICIVPEHSGKIRGGGHRDISAENPGVSNSNAFLRAIGSFVPATRWARQGEISAPYLTPESLTIICRLTFQARINSPYMIRPKDAGLPRN